MDQYNYGELLPAARAEADRQRFELMASAVAASERAIQELVPACRAPGCWCAYGFDNRLRHSIRCERSAAAMAAIQKIKQGTPAASSGRGNDDRVRIEALVVENSTMRRKLEDLRKVADDLDRSPAGVCTCDPCISLRLRAVLDA